MTLRRSDRIRRQTARACALAAGLWISASAYSADLSLAAQDLPPPQATSPQAQLLISKTNLAIARLQDITNRASELATQALAMLGINYRYGGNSPDTGLDCSGLVRYVFKEAWGTDLPRTSLEISRVGEKIGSDNLQPGDLVFYNTLRRGFSHVGIYLGDGKFIHSPSAGGQVRIESMDESYWKKRFNGARRIIAGEEEQK
ncbi:C40 family peptidase [Herbaspirillum huttiense]|jgi:cell wall-associated NlpC family hydrolase|uniref:C40 family peptidase n=2 Tax=root TaxID=1 RepID=A0ABU2EKZ0_9BURK|nr:MULTISPECIES: C40 family peptidase [Herbaspirillum]MAF05370.1 peptidoglycan endopeptidase [Herbaspirillum sp.]MBN9359605.1 C40 family peptidase [Herbaspirillum huttiense]MBO14905.1 peptidoglycan endopeptidase [Herbaspirillum sp.]MBP1315718.1 cell wall-associated NlpC family hydrolase [Herbaspirillum sp. 1130]MCO4858290.1 C40 family peptidase [Herbaspirillum sp. WGmk3]|tara:strand:- start:1817 stop:2419 length:603 start_codon:yes stop_codon:yes gene_type:complete